MTLNLQKLKDHPLRRRLLQTLAEHGGCALQRDLMKALQIRNHHLLIYHIARLEAGGVVTVRRWFVGARPQTTVTLVEPAVTAHVNSKLEEVRA